MIKLTQQQISILKRHEEYLRTAYYSQYIRNLSARAAMELGDLYEQLGFVKMGMNCGLCKLRMCETLGQIYFSQVELKKK